MNTHVNCKRVILRMPHFTTNNDIILTTFLTILFVTCVQQSNNAEASLQNYALFFNALL